MSILLLAGNQQIDLAEYTQQDGPIKISIDKNAEIILSCSSQYETLDLTIELQEHAQLDLYLKPSQSYNANTTIELRLFGAHSRATIDLRQILGQTNMHTIQTKQLHYGPHTISVCTIRSAQYDQSMSHYEGLIVIEPDAIGAQADQDHKALLMSDAAHAYARPTLEAKTNEVQCGHGSAISYLDQEQLWYLESRGIASSAASTLLVDAFLQQ